MPATTHSLEQFAFSDMMACRTAFRTMFDDRPPTMEAAAGRVVRFLHERLVDGEGNPACALVRLFCTYPFAALPEPLQDIARGVDREGALTDDARCLTLMATAGALPEWNDRETSRGHQVIPLASEEFIARAPMIAQLLRQFGVDLARINRPSPEVFVSGGETTFDVFYVAHAPGSPYIPAQEDFVVPFGVRSVLGFGGMLGGNDFFAAILFSRVPVSRETADAFKVLGLNLRVGLLSVSRRAMFRGAERTTS